MGEWIDSPTGEARRDEQYASAEVIEIPKYYQSIGDPWSLISTQFETTSAYAENSYYATQGFIEDIRQMIAELEMFNIPDISVDSPEIPSIDYNGRPNMGKLDLDPLWPKNTASRPVLDKLPTIVAPNIPLSIHMPEKPQPRILHDPGDPPVINDTVLPTKPSYTLPDVPVLAEIIIPSAPAISIPDFDAELADEVFEIPPGMNYTESPFNSPIWDSLLEKVLDGIRNGGKALEPDVEAGIWERTLSRLQVEEQAGYEELERYWSTKGWDMPQGSLAGALIEKSGEIGRNRRETTLDIGTKQAELAHQDTQFIMQLGKDSEIILRDFHNNQMNRKLEAEKAVAQNAIEILNATISRFNAKIEKYKADAAVYGERVKATLTKVEIFKAQVEAAKVTSEVHGNLIDLYEKQIQAVDTIIKIYHTEMQGADISSQIEARKIDIFKSRIDAYVAEIGGEKAKYEMFGIEVDAEKSKVEIFSERVKAFDSQVRLVETQLRVQVAELEGKAKKNDHELDRYKAELGAYAVELDAASKKVSAVVDAFRGEVDGYNAETRAVAAKYTALAAEIGLRIDEARFFLEKAKAEIESKTNGYIALKNLQLTGLTGVTGVSAQLAASAMNAVNASTSFGYSSSESMGTHFSYGASNSESHNFTHPVQQLK